MNSTGPQIASAILAAYREGNGVFEKKSELLENQLPEGVEPCSGEHARFYFFLISNDHGTRSVTLYEKFRSLFRDRSELFSPEHIIRNSPSDGVPPESLWNAISKLGLRYPKQSLKSWWDNSVRLVKSYNGEPLALFRSTPDAIELFKQIQKFRGYGPKTAGLLIRVIAGMGFNDLKNLTEVPVPVDVHDTRIAYWTGLYRPNGESADANSLSNNPIHVRSVSKLWRNIANELCEPWIELDRALWLLGSKGCVERVCYSCPAKTWCEEGKRVLFSMGNGVETKR